MTIIFTLKLIGIILPLIHLIGIAFAIHAILTVRTSQGAIAWAMTLAFFPYAAIPLYLVFGRKKFYGYVKARRSGDRRIDNVAEKICRQMQPDEAQLTGDDAHFAVLKKLTLTPWTTGNAGRLLIDGDATFTAIFAAIDSRNATC